MALLGNSGEVRLSHSRSLLHLEGWSKLADVTSCPTSIISIACSGQERGPDI